MPGSDDDSGTTSRILVLDSDEKVLEICQRILEDEGFDVRVTTSTNEALDELEKQIFDVVVADIDMPEMGGQDLFREIQVPPARCPGHHDGPLQSHGRSCRDS